VKIRDIADHLRQVLIDSPHEKPRKVRTGTELTFVQRFLCDWGYDLPDKKIKSLAAKAKTYEIFIRSATK